MITVGCPNCHGAAAYSPEHVGRVVSCPHCRRDFRLRLMERAAPAGAPARGTENMERSLRVIAAGVWTIAGLLIAGVVLSILVAALSRPHYPY